MDNQLSDIFVFFLMPLPALAAITCIVCAARVRKWYWKAALLAAAFVLLLPFVFCALISFPSLVTFKFTALYFSLTFLTTASVLIGAIVCAVCALRDKIPKWYKKVVYAIITLTLLFVPAFFTEVFAPEFNDARFRTYKRFYRDIEVGMTRADVEQLITKHYPHGGKRGTPITNHDSEDYLYYWMDPEGTREPNCEGISIQFQDGKIVKKDYIPD